MEEQVQQVKKRGRPPSSAEKEMKRLDEKFQAFEENVKELSARGINETPVSESEQQTKMSQNEIRKSKDIYLKPTKTIFGTDFKTKEPETFNEKYRKDYEFDKEYVQFIAEHKEIIGETIPMWTKKYKGIPAEYWEVPSNKPVWGPRYLAEQIKGCSYNRLKMEENQATSTDGYGTYTGQLAVSQRISRLDAYPVGTKRSVFV